MKLVYVRWIDSAGSDRWNKDTIDTQTCESVGWLLSKNKQRIVLSSSRTSKDHSDSPWGMQMAIPRGAIIEMRKL